MLNQVATGSSSQFGASHYSNIAPKFVKKQRNRDSHSVEPGPNLK